MSLVGTRPILQDELLKYELHHRARIAIKPGISSLVATALLRQWNQTDRLLRRENAGGDPAAGRGLHRWQAPCI